MPPLALLLQGVLLGLGAAVPIGPVNVEIARRALRQGFGAAFALGCGAVTVDVFYAALTSFGLKSVPGQAVLYWPSAVGGVALLTYLGVRCWMAAASGWDKDPLAATSEVPGNATPTAVQSGGGSRGTSGPPQRRAASPPHRGHYFTGLLMTLLNPMTLAFWFVVVPNVALASPAPAGDGPGTVTGRSPWHLPIICVGVFAGAFAWVVFFGGLLSFAGRWRKRWWLVAADAAGGTVLLGFAAASAAALWHTLRPLL